MNPLVSVLVPVYNTKRFLEPCLKSLAEQTYRNYEVIVVDDGSTDNSGSVCDDWAARCDQVKVIHQDNAGLMSARLAALSCANGEYICHVDSDDFVSPDYLLCLVELAVRYNADMVVSRSSNYNGSTATPRACKLTKECYSKNEIRNEIYPSLLHGETFFSRVFPIQNWGKLIRTSIVRQNIKYYDTSIMYGEDLNMVFPAILDCNQICFCSDDRAQYYYRNNPDSIVNSYKKNMFRQIKTLHQKLMECSDEKAVFDFSKQIEADFLDCSLYCISNELKSRLGPFEICRNTREITGDAWLRNVISNTDFSHYEAKYKCALTVLKTIVGTKQHLCYPDTLVSIVMPMYNSRRYLSEAIDSVILQSYPNWELIIVDDGSTDGSSALADAYAKKDRRIRSISQNNQGSSAARNTGIRNANGDVIAFLDSDDKYSPDFLFRMLSAMQKTQADIVMCDYDVNGSAEYGYQDQILSGEEIVQAYVHGRVENRIMNKIYRRSLVEDIPFPEGKNIMEDGVWTPKVLLKAGTVSVLHDPLYCYRVCEGSLSRHRYVSHQEASGLFSNMMERDAFLLEHFKNDDADVISRVLNDLNYIFQSCYDLAYWQTDEQANDLVEKHYELLLSGCRSQTETKLIELLKQYDAKTARKKYHRYVALSLQVSPHDKMTLLKSVIKTILLGNDEP